MTLWFSQYFALLKRHATLKGRSPLATILEILAPVICACSLTSLIVFCDLSGYDYGCTYYREVGVA